MCMCNTKCQSGDFLSYLEPKNSSIHKLLMFSIVVFFRSHCFVRRSEVAYKVPHQKAPKKNQISQSPGRSLSNGSWHLRELNAAGVQDLGTRQPNRTVALQWSGYICYIVHKYTMVINFMYPLQQSCMPVLVVKTIPMTHPRCVYVDGGTRSTLGHLSDPSHFTRTTVTIV